MAKNKETVNKTVLTHAVIALNNGHPMVVQNVTKWKTIVGPDDRPLRPIMTLDEMVSMEQRVVNPMDLELSPYVEMSPRFLAGLKLAPKGRAFVDQQAASGVTVDFVPLDSELLLYPRRQEEEPVANVARCFFVGLRSIAEATTAFAYDRVTGVMERMGSFNTRYFIDDCSNLGMRLVRLPCSLLVTPEEFNAWDKILCAVLDEPEPTFTVKCKGDVKDTHKFESWDAELGEFLDAQDKKFNGGVFSGAGNVARNGWVDGHPSLELVKMVVEGSYSDSDSIVRGHLSRCILCCSKVLGMAVPQLKYG